ncbi:hypothetical protein [Xanthocytophaga flava]|uniref:hypothetical protein n=1 Tax=Xanthocytophaga flava TaxID=3048013 RepID=UPI0028D1C303|nr:hypothetical protein [Xanthocytophaga flavus]MDJ1473356.1 hypothetical protein [Xanthocytophaga flavus]
MNPFETIDPKDKLTENAKSIHYGRHELLFEQIFPFREPLYGQLVLKLKHPHRVEPVLALYKKMPDSVQYLIKVYRQNT